MATEADAQAAITQMHGRDFGGRSLTVNEAKPRPERSGGFGGGGGGNRRREPRW
jgi:RNA recognition motif-containing protein